jgi:hypothetical protein
VTTVFEILGRVLAASLDSVWAGSSPAALIGLAGMAGAIGLMAMVAAWRVRSAVALEAALGVRPRRERNAEPADRSVLLSQSNPDADGRPRPRAPGRPLLTA